MCKLSGLGWGVGKGCIIIIQVTKLSGKQHIVYLQGHTIQAATHRTILSKFGNGRHVRTLQMHGFPVQTYGKHSRGISLIQRYESTIPAVKFLVWIHSVCPQKL